MADSRDRSLPVRRILVAAAVLAVVVGGGALLGRSLRHTDGSPARTASARSGSMVATSQHRFTRADYFAAPVVALSRLPASAAKGRIALPWRQLAVRHNQVDVVFASRPSCEQLKGVVIEQSATAVTVDVLASNIVNAPNCDVVPKLKRAVVTLAAPLAARSLRHAGLDASYWPTDPFNEG